MKLNTKLLLLMIVLVSVIFIGTWVAVDTFGIIGGILAMPVAWLLGFYGPAIIENLHKDDV